jgi:DNA primase
VARLSDELIEEIRASHDIVELISEYVPLKKQGKNYTGLCPFHEEKKPSFSVSPQRQIFHCFGCGMGGNIFKFLMEYQKMSFLDAVQFLADRAHIALPVRDRGGGDASQYEALYEANHLAAAHYYQQLRENVDAEKARRYLRERGFSDPIVEVFRLGYAPPGWDGLINRARRRGISPETLHRAGLVQKRDYGEGYYDYFRDRLIFPITNVSGKFIGFGGRVLQETDEVKYINSPETPIYQKGKVLYGLHQASTAIRQAGRAVIVEGYTDLLGLAQAGVENVVASLGTALTHQQARLLSRYAKEAVLLYDADPAGMAAAERGADTLLGAGMSVRVLSLPSGMDPDQAVRQKGREYIVAELNRAETFLDFKLRHLLQRQDSASVDGRAEVIAGLGGTIAMIADPIKRGLYIREVAERLSVDEKLVALSVDRASPRPRRKGRDEVTVGEVVKGGADLLERKILALLLQNPLTIRDWKKKILPEDFAQPDHRRIAEHLLSLDRQVPKTSADMLNTLSELDLDSLISRLCFMEEEGEAARLLDDYARKLKINRLLREERKLRKQLHQAEQARDQTQVDRLTQRLNEIARERFQRTSISSSEGPLAPM